MEISQFGALLRRAAALRVCLDAKKAGRGVLQNDFNREENGYSAHALSAEHDFERKCDRRRAVHCVETDSAWASCAPVGLIHGVWSIRSVSHYALGVFFVLSHLLA
jgi:hypothetical protein